jgi:Domain of unknown function (DUF4395)
VRESRLRKVQGARGHHPREDLELEDARLDCRIFLGQCSRLVDAASEEADPAQPPLHARVARRAGGKELARLVQFREEGEMPVLQLGGSRVVELRSVVRGEQEHHRDAVEFHPAMLILSGMKRAARLADPYRDLDVIDSRAPRINQATIGLLSLLAVLTGWWWLLGILAAQLAVGLTFGRRYCLACVAYFELVQPRFGEGRSRMHGRRGSRISSGRSSSALERSPTPSGS